MNNKMIKLTNNELEIIIKGLEKVAATAPSEEDKHFVESLKTRLEDNKESLEEELLKMLND